MGRACVASARSLTPIREPVPPDLLGHSLTELINDMKLRKAKQLELGEHADAQEFSVVTALANFLDMAAPEELRSIVIPKVTEYLKWRGKELARLLGAMNQGAGCRGTYEIGPEQEQAPVIDRESFLQMKDFLLSHYRDMFVAFAGGQVVAASRSMDELFDKLDAMDPSIEVCVERVDERAFQGPVHHVMTGVRAAREVTRTP